MFFVWGVLCHYFKSATKLKQILTARQDPNMTRQTNPTLPAVSVADAPLEGNFLDIFNRTNMMSTER